MPRAHTELERARIRERLLVAGRAQFERRSLAKATIAELAAGAGIGKGSFYQFFESKEALFMAILEDEERSFHAELLEDLDRTVEPRRAIQTLLEAAATRLHTRPFLRLVLDPATINALLLRLDPNTVAEHRRGDQLFFERLATRWKREGILRKEVRPSVVFDVVSAMFALSVQRALLGEAQTQRAVREIAAAMAERWAPTR